MQSLEALLAKERALKCAIKKSSCCGVPGCTNGPQGLQGPAGGGPGSQGPAGPQGPAGYWFLQGLPVPYGATVTFESTTLSVVTSPGELMITSNVQSGTGNPNLTGASGATDNIYFDLAGGIYVNDNGGDVWTLVSLGVQGPTGPQGPQGIGGAQGFQGPQGAFGLTGFQGAQGLQGAQGFQGDPGLTGTQGAQGPPGPQGIQGLSGDTGNTGTPGVQGGQGPQGPQGGAGIQGSPGLQGPQGFQGAQGAQGVQGAQGFQGPQGFQGAQGFQGQQGPQGPQGPQGAQGFQGIQGAAYATANNGFLAVQTTVSGTQTIENGTSTAIMFDSTTANQYTYSNGGIYQATPVSIGNIGSTQTGIYLIGTQVTLQVSAGTTNTGLYEILLYIQNAANNVLQVNQYMVDIAYFEVVGYISMSLTSTISVPTPDTFSVYVATGGVGIASGNIETVPYNVGASAGMPTYFYMQQLR